jgi:hypothetical protein
MGALLRTILVGAAAGAASTVPMTVAMLALHSQLPAAERYPVPPSLITKRIEQKARVRPKTSPKGHRAFAVTNHFGYGAACGVLYALGTTRPRTAFADALLGVTFALGVWAASYFVILPSLGLHGGVERTPPWRNAMMVAAHIVWGGSLGMVRRLLRIQSPG